MPEPLFQKSCTPKACNFIKKETLAQVFFCEFCEISRNIFSTEHLQTTASEGSKIYELVLFNNIFVQLF